jgi:hypothetical protein
MEQRLRLVQGGGQQRLDKRSSERHPLAVPGQIVWKDAKGNTKLIEVVTRDVSETGVAVEALQGGAIPLYRLVYFQVDRSVRHLPHIPPALRKPNILSAIFRVDADNPATGGPSGYALRLLVEPERTAVTTPNPDWTSRQQPLTA